MNEIVEKRTPELIGAEIRMYVEAGRRITLLCGIEIGRRLVEAKELLQHGEWLPWLERETDFSSSSAQRYMQVFREYGAAQQSLFGPVANSPTLGNLSISNALRLLALPEEEREGFAGEHDVEHLSTREVEELVRARTAEIEAEKDRAERERVEAETAKDAAEKEAQTAQKALGMARDKIRELEARPVPVAVERDEKAIEEAARKAREEAAKDLERDILAAKKEAKAAADKQIAELRKQIDSANSARAKMETELRELNAKAEAAQKAGTEAEQLRGQIRALEAKLAFAAPEVAAFKAAFDRAQAELVRMIEALEKVQDEAVWAKLSKAAKTMLGNFVEKAGS